MSPRFGFGVYLHWPFCAAKCPYCDFNSHVASNVDQTQWATAFVSGIQRSAAELPDRMVTSIYFGGGTPSLMDPSTVEVILSSIRSNWSLANDVEVTLEANPTSVEANRFRGFRAAGVDRISLGVQALDDSALRQLGRLHSVEDAMRSFDLARGLFPRASFDLIYARQGQTVEDWRNELGRALELEPDHLSLYQLTIEPGTAFGTRHSAGRLAGLPSEDLAADLFELTQEETTAAGLPAYEISNHARPGYESRHNLTYWRGGDWVGIGPGAHGRVTIDGERWATTAHLSPGGWLAAVEGKYCGEAERIRLSDEDASAELLMLGLRTEAGISTDRVDAGILSRAVKLGEDGLMEIGDTVRVTPKGRPILNAILGSLLA